ncbi:amino acid adenylation domain-containing protein [Sporomusaceae bacterium BoRhaA]|uniref:non-ribosomal peptide synthetase n=1 Tax=Pelorhabdus rhamnosifermentans TaxID=2772457 RepID=UPI001C062058|nr:non-ribosomal peptide synthetase [Pelorhabdus rhamnosifermentans]MBU2703324.1 amino acid adenylation domain-containing protein [Pelorhabdus rhamnosifermentans]
MHKTGVVHAEYPLTSYQKDIWLEQCLYSGKPIYNLGGYIAIQGIIDPEIFGEAIHTLIKNNDSLRIRIIEKASEPYLKILSEVKYDVPFYDFSSREEPDTACLNWLKQEFLKPFEFDGNLFQFALLKSDDQTYFWLLKFHHIIIDGFGVSMLYKQVIEKYNQIATGSKEPDKTIYSYTEFIEENNRYLSSPAFLKDKEFWQEKYQAIPEPLFNRNMDDHGNSVVSDRITFSIKRSLYDQVVAFSQANGCTAFHFILAVLSIYFGRVCSRDELVIGVPISNRGKAKNKQIMGLFANVIPLRVQLEEKLSFRELMLAIKGNLMEDYRHQKFPFGEIYRTVFNQAKDKGNLFDISLSYVNREFSENFITASNYDIVSMAHQHERNALTIFVREYNSERDIDIDFDYQLSAFEKFIPIDHVAMHFNYLLGEMLKSSEKSISEIEIIPEEEKHKLLCDFNDTKAAYCREQTIQTVFEEQAAKMPEKLAVVADSKQLTYGELNAKANQLARVLIRNGVKPDGIVGIMANRSIAMVISILGVLKAGGAYLPIDPTYPPDRIQYMLEDSSTGILLTQGQLKDSYAYQGKVLDMEDISLYRGDAGNLGRINTSENLAYIIYTSGSTGKPKGVMIEHRGIINLTTFFSENYQLGGQDKMLQFASSSFDASVWEMFTSLLIGATLFIVKRETINNLVDFENYINNNGITVTLLPPTYLNGIKPERVPKLKQLFTGGSAITKGLVDKWKDRVAYRNAYGPTEATVIATTWEYNEQELGDGLVPIGGPISNTEIWILDEGNRLLPMGAVGELCIGGDGLARGYLNRPKLTAEKFVPHPYCKGVRMYKTGDLARWKPDGNIEYIGRSDSQVKIRGFRIELGEIETRLVKHQSVKDAVVIEKKDSQGDTYLVAYFVSDDKLTVDELREYLVKELPDYMVPAYIIRLDRMPLTLNGKIDKRVLPEPDRSIDSDVEYIAPKNETEAVLVHVWQNVLQTERIGVKDNFFHLGGDSIKAIQVLSQLNDYGLKLEMKDLFKHPVIEEVSSLVKKVANIVEQGIVEGNANLTPVQHWLFEQRFGEKHHFNQSVLIYGSQGFAEGILRKVFTKLVEHHDALRMVVSREGDGIVLYNRGMEGQLYSLETVDLLNQDNFLAAIEAEADRLQKSIDLDNGPLVKACRFQTRAGDYLLLVIHHLVVDGVSWRIILQDLFNGYMQASKDEEIKFPAKTDSFSDWSAQLSAYANRRELLSEIDYWVGLEAVNINPLPKDRPITERKYQDIEQVRVELTGEDTARLLKDVNRAYNTEVNDILLAALGFAIGEWTGQENVLINLEGHGREEIIQNVDVSRTVGWFTAQYPVVLNWGEKRDLANRIKAVKENLRQIPNKGIGYGILKYLTLPENKDSLRFNLKPEISFNYLGQFDIVTDRDLFSIADVSLGQGMSPNMECPYAVDINGMVNQGRLMLTFAYHNGEYERETIAKFAARFQEKLTQIIHHCAKSDDTEQTPSDFTYKKLTMDELQAVFSNVNTRNIKDLYTLSPMQEGLLYHAMLDHTSSAYFEQVMLSIEGRLDIIQLERSFQMLVDQHDSFRTLFVYEKIVPPVQVVMKEQKACIQVENITHLSAEDQKAFIAAFKEQDKMKRFDLSKGQLIRLSIIQTGNDCCKLIWSFHHIIMDGWCLGIILREFFRGYAVLHKNQLPQPAAVYPYSDYINWLDTQDDNTAAAYWEGYLQDYEETALLPKNAGVPVQGSYEGAEFLFSLEENTRYDLENMARKSHVTLSTLFQTVWGLLLARYNNMNDVVFGTVVSGRPHEIAGVENMVGLFINTLPVRIKFDDSQELVSLLQSVQQAAIDAEQYGYCPLVEIQGRTVLKDDLFNHIVAFENYPLEEVTKDDTGVMITGSEVFEQTNYDLNVVIIPGRELSIKFIYNAMVYDKWFIEGLEGQIRAMLADVLDHPGVLVKDISIMTEAEEKKLLYAFNHTEVEYSKDKTIPELFEEQVMRTPDNIAVAFLTQRLTYHAINEKANQLARMLRGKGVKANSIVGIMAERSPEMILGIIGILKAGGTYLPIDPEYPADRISYMLQDSRTRILLTQKHLVHKISFAGELIDLDCPDVYQGDSANLTHENTMRDIAYVIYTSGSTGTPKGVQIEQASLMNLASWHRRVYNIASEDRATVVAGQAFDASVWEIWPYLLAGAGLYIPDHETRMSPLKLIEWLQHYQISVCFMPTPLAEALLVEKWPPVIALRAMLTGGDKLHRRPSPTLSFRLFNHYGPTESTVVTTWGVVSPANHDAALPPIGRPMDNTQVYIVDRNNHLQPVGALGELCISSDGLARGYLNRPELTAEKFVENPFTPGKRMYRTGDLARWLSDGNIEFVGRMDQQVKIRGFRIELGEIENRLLQHPFVKEAVVIVRQDHANDKYLAAYVVAETEVTTDELREYMLMELPEYMVPVYFTQLNKLPVTSNGKIDRRALPQPDEWRVSEEKYTAPRNKADERIQDVWQEILGLDRIGIDDNFFVLGGNSLKAIQVVAKLALDFEIGINDLFQSQTIRKLSDTIKYSKDRLKEMLEGMGEIAATREKCSGFDGELRCALRDYRLKNKVYQQMDLFQTLQGKNILLVGGTGYLGIHILYQLLKHTDYRVFVMVRGENDNVARDRLWGKLDFYFHLKQSQCDCFQTRLCVFHGDISKEYFSLTPEKYLELADKIDYIINSAANVKHYGHYSEFSDVNVTGNQKLVEFASIGIPKAYNFISTTSIGSGFIDGKDKVVFTEYDCDLGQNSDNYYVATKLEAEKFLFKSRREGLDVNIFRVGNLVFNSSSGVFQENITNNAFYALVKSLIKLGCFPEIKDNILNFSFIDYVAKAIVLLFDKKNLQGETYHIFNPRQISIISFAELLKQTGIQADTVALNKFVTYLYARYEDEEIQNYITRILVHSNVFFEGASKTAFIVRNQKTERILQALDFNWPKLDSLKVKLMLEHCRKVGFI